MQVRETRLEKSHGARDSRAWKVSRVESLSETGRRKPWALTFTFWGAPMPAWLETGKYRVPRTLEFVTRFRGAKGSGDLAAVRHNHPLRRPLPVTEPRFLARDRPCRFTAPFVTDDPVVRPPRKVSRLRENRHGCRRERLHSFMGPFQPPGPAPLGFLRARRGAAARSSR